MARNGSGVFSLPAGSTVSNGDVSDASDINGPLADLEADANTPRPIVAGGTGASTAAAAYANLVQRGTSAPSTMVAGMLWLDTGVSPAVLRVRNAANSAWIALGPETVAAKTIRGNSGASAAAVGDIDMATLKTMLGYTGSLGGSGYQVLPSGLILQWLTSSVIASGVQATQTFPFTFPNAHFATLTTYVSAAATVPGNTPIGHVVPVSTAAFAIRNLYQASAQYYCFSIGN